MSSSVVKLIQRVLYPPVFDDEKDNALAHQFHFLLLAGVLIAASFAGIMGFLLNELRSAVLVTATTGLLAIMFLMLQQKRLRFTIIGTIASAYLAVTVAILFFGGIRDSAYIVYLILIIMTSVYLGVNATLIVGITTFVLTLIIYGLETMGLIEANSITPVEVHHLLISLLVVGMTTILLRMTVNQIVANSQKIEEQSASLREQNQELNQIRASLEQRTAELVSLNAALESEIEERKFTESALRQKQKLESIGLLAGGVAHDFNNILTAVLGQSSLAKFKLEPEHAAIEHVEKVVQSAKRAAELTRQLLAYAGKAHFQVESLDVNRLIRENEELFDVVLQNGAQIHYQLQDNLPAIQADRVQIQQILMNLLFNASEAITNNDGLIQISTYSDSFEEESTVMEVQESGPSIGKRPHNGRYICVQICDNGCGIKEEDLEKIFDPFFTTKEEGRGLGLSAILGIIRGHQGTIHVTSKVERGSQFCVYLPVDQKTTLPSLSPDRALDAKKYSGRVLIVDDEAPIREAVSEILAIAGFETTVAENGPAALEQFRQNCDQIDVILLDVQMPGLSGVELYDRLCEISPDVRIILASGYSESDVARQFTDLKRQNILHKPFDIDNLVRRISDSIGGTQS